MEQNQEVQPKTEATEFAHGAQLDLHKSRLTPVEEARALAMAASVRSSAEYSGADETKPTKEVHQPALNKFEQVAAVGGAVIALRQEALGTGEN